MTTIAYRDGVLAADSRTMVAGWIQPHAVRKLFRMADGTVCAVTGDLAISEAYVRWIDAGRDGPMPSLGDEGRVIHLGRDGILTIYENIGSFQIACEFTAFGSGSPAAQAAMFAGADARRAVELACLIDPNSGGEILTMSCQ